MATDREKFKEFFDDMGVHYDEWDGEPGEKILSVAQAHFWFSEDDYVGVEADESGKFCTRDEDEYKYRVFDQHLAKEKP